MSKLADLYHPIINISPTSCACCNRCLRRFMLKYCCYLRPVGPKPFTLIYEEALHRALPFCLLGDEQTALDIFTKVWGDTVGNDFYNPVHAKESIEHFSWRYKTASLYEIIKPPYTGLHIDNSFSEMEMIFKVDIGIPIPLIGRVDALAKEKDTGKIWGIDFKVTSECSQRFMSGFNLSPQILTYELGIWTVINKCPAGILLELIRTIKNKAFTATLPIRVNEYAISEIVKLYQRTWQKYKAAEIDYLDKNILFPKNEFMCNTYSAFGTPGFTCEFQPLCSVPGDQIDVLLGMYEIGDPKEFIIEI